MKSTFTIVTLILLCCVLYTAEATITEKTDSALESKSIGRQLLEQGRTLVHHTVKRFMIILPAIFFKLGIAFTLLILIALAAVNNGFIGFLLLVVGMSSVLARLQETRRAPVSVPYISPVPPYHHHVWDRSDSAMVDRSQDSKAPLYSGYNGYSGYSPQLTSYYNKYGATKV